MIWELCYIVKLVRIIKGVGEKSKERKNLDRSALNLRQRFAEMIVFYTSFTNQAKNLKKSLDCILCSNQPKVLRYGVRFIMLWLLYKKKSLLNIVMTFIQMIFLV